MVVWVGKKWTKTKTKVKCGAWYPRNWKITIWANKHNRNPTVTLAEAKHSVMAASRIIAHLPPHPHRAVPHSPPLEHPPPSLNFKPHPKRHRNIAIRASLRGHKENDLNLRTTPDDVHGDTVSKDPLVLPRSYLFPLFLPSFLIFVNFFVIYFRAFVLEPVLCFSFR